MMHVGVYLEYRGGCPVPWGDIMINEGDILSTVGDIMMHLGDIMSTVGVFNTVGDTILCNLSAVRDYHDACGGYNEYRGDVQYHGGTQITRFFPVTHDVPLRAS